METGERKTSVWSIMLGVLLFMILFECPRLLCVSAIGGIAFLSVFGITFRGCLIGYMRYIVGLQISVVDHRCFLCLDLIVDHKEITYMSLCWTTNLQITGQTILFINLYAIPERCINIYALFYGGLPNSMLILHLLTISPTNSSLS